jgi:cell division protease FtsH
LLFKEWLQPDLRKEPRRWQAEGKDLNIPEKRSSESDLRESRSFNLRDNTKIKQLTLWMIAIVSVILLYNMFQGRRVQPEDLSYSQFLTAVEQDKVESVTITGNQIEGKYKSAKAEPREFRTYALVEFDLLEKLRGNKVEMEVKEVSENVLLYVLTSWFPMLIIIGIWIFFMRQMQGGGNKALSFGKSRARLLTENQKKVTFSDVAGIEEAKEELSEIIDFLKDPQKFQRLGGRIPKGVLLVGPPGTGKTLLARAIAGEADVPFFNISGSDFVEMFVGVGASRVRDLFEQGKKNAPCIIFIDEIDAVGRHRGAGLGGGHDEREQTLNQLLVEMDGFESNEGVIIVAATNRPDVLDPALLRPGRFDRQVFVANPDVRGRLAILKVHARKIPLAADVDLSILARGTPGFSGADLANLINEAALYAARRNKASVEMKDLDDAKDKVMMGSERRSMVMSDEEKRTTAYHESGHALVAKLLPGADPVHKLTIIPRGRALGLTQQLPVDDRHTYSKDYLLSQIRILMGGRAAEDVIFNQQTSGAGNDIERATEIARKMVCEWGMSEEMGPLSYGKREEQIFLGREISQHKDYSERTAQAIDRAVKRIVSENFLKARQLLVDNIDKLHKLAKALLEHEVLDANQINDIVASST